MFGNQVSEITDNQLIVGINAFSEFVDERVFWYFIFCLSLNKI